MIKGWGNPSKSSPPGRGTSSADSSSNPDALCFPATSGQKNPSNQATPPATQTRPNTRSTNAAPARPPPSAPHRGSKPLAQGRDGTGRRAKAQPGRGSPRCRGAEGSGHRHPSGSCRPLRTAEDAGRLRRREQVRGAQPRGGGARGGEGRAVAAAGTPSLPRSLPPSLFLLSRSLTLRQDGARNSLAGAAPDDSLEAGECRYLLPARGFPAAGSSCSAWRGVNEEGSDTGPAASRGSLGGERGTGLGRRRAQRAALARVPAVGREGRAGRAAPAGGAAGRESVELPPAAGRRLPRGFLLRRASMLGFAPPGLGSATGAPGRGEGWAGRRLRLPKPPCRRARRCSGRGRLVRSAGERDLQRGKFCQPAAGGRDGLVRCVRR